MTAIPTTLAELNGTLPSLSSFLSQLGSDLSSHAPPATLFIEAQTNAALILPIIQLILNSTTTCSPSSSTRPSIQSLLPKVAVVDLTEVHSTRAAFDRVLNSLSGWIPQDCTPFSGWSEADQAVPNWDGRTEGCSVSRLKRASSPAKPSSRPAKRRKRDQVVSDSEDEVPSSTQEDEHDAADSSAPSAEWVLRWDRSASSTAKDPVGPIRDTLDYFYSSLKTISTLGTDGTRQARPAHRWLVFDHAEMLHDLPSAGNVGGAPKETGLGMTFASSIYRVGQKVSGTRSCSRMVVCGQS